MIHPKKLNTVLHQADNPPSFDHRIPHDGHQTQQQLSKKESTIDAAKKMKDRAKN